MILQRTDKHTHIKKESLSGIENCTHKTVGRAIEWGAQQLIFHRIHTMQWDRELYTEMQIRERYGLFKKKW